jgi:hypothetical protein
VIFSYIGSPQNLLNIQKNSAKQAPTSYRLIMVCEYILAGHLKNGTMGLAKVTTKAVTNVKF